MKDFKKFILFASKCLLWNSIWIFPCICVLIWLCVSDSVKSPIGLVCSFLFIGGMLSVGIWSFAGRLKDDVSPERNMQASEPSLYSLLGGLGQFHDTPYWKTLHWFAVAGFLILTFVVMGWGMSSLFIENDSLTIAFIWIFSFFITFTLFWLVIMITRRGRMWKWFLLFYIVFDLLSAFTFNYFHFYDNVSKTQRMENSIKYSRELVEIVRTPISEELTSLDSIQSTLEVKNLFLESERQQTILEGIIQERENPQYIINEVQNPDGSITKKQTRKRNEWELNKDEKAANRRLSEITVKINEAYKGTSGMSMYDILKKEDSICLTIHRKIRDFEHAEDKKMKPLIRDSIVNDISVLGGMLRKTNLSDIPKDSIEHMAAIIKIPEVTRLESINALFNAIQRVFTPNKIKGEIVASEDRLVYMSVALSVLIDLLPMLLGLFVALSTAPPDYTKKRFLKEAKIES